MVGSKGNQHVSLRRGTIDSLARFSADSTLIGPTKEKNRLWPFIFLLPPDSVISLKLLVPQKSFTYQNLQDFIGKSTKVFSK